MVEAGRGVLAVVDCQRNWDSSFPDQFPDHRPSPPPPKLKRLPLWPEVMKLPSVLESRPCPSCKRFARGKGRWEVTR